MGKLPVIYMAQSGKFMIPPKFEDTKTQDFKYVFASGVFGLLEPNGGRIIFFLDRLEPETMSEPVPGNQRLKKIIRESQVEVNMTPAQFKSISTWMLNQVKNYENVFGEIVTAPKGQQPKPTPSGIVS
jgi:hypothetical protein